MDTNLPISSIDVNILNNHKEHDNALYFHVYIV